MSDRSSKSIVSNRNETYILMESEVEAVRCKCVKIPKKFG